MKNSSVVSHRIALAALALSLSASPLLAAKPLAPRTYQEVANWAQLPPGEAWQDMMSVDIDAKGNIYVLQRTPSKVMVFDAQGKFLRSWGDGQFPGAHGLRIDRFGYLWTTDRKRHQVMKFTTDGKLLMELGTNGVPGDDTSRTSLNGPSDVVVGPNGDIFVSDGESSNSRIVKFSKDGAFIKSWGTKGAGPGQLQIPHSIVMDDKGKLYVANRGNSRIEMFDQEGGYLGQITNVGRPYGLFMAHDGVIYVTDGTKGSESLTVEDTHSGKILSHMTGFFGPHMLSVDRSGAIYLAQVKGKAVRKFARTDAGAAGGAAK